MLPDTIELYYKYKIFNSILRDNLQILFVKKENNEIDFDLFFNYYNHIISKYRTIVSDLNCYRKNRSRIQKKFNHGKFYILLRPHFCHDFTNLIISFIQ